MKRLTDDAIEQQPEILTLNIVRTLQNIKELEKITVEHGNINGNSDNTKDNANDNEKMSTL